jgi:Protein phosphatase 2C
MWKVIGASVTGTSHTARGAGCQDASGWRSEPDLTCLAIADGAGSRPLSAIGSALAVERALAVAGTAQTDETRANQAPRPADWIHAAFTDARTQISAMADSAGHKADDYATTLAIAIIAADIVAIGQVGDSTVVIGDGGRYRTIAPEAKGEYVNETLFVTAPDALDHLRITVLPAKEVELVVLSTDGLRYKILSDLTVSTPFEPFFDDLSGYIRTPSASQSGIAEFLGSLNDQTGDDKTLVAAIRLDPPRQPDQDTP